MNRWRRKVRYFYYRFRRLKGDPHRVALAVALGVFIGITPTIPFHLITILGLTTIFRLSRLAAVLGCTVISNPLTVAPTYYLCFKIGKLLLFPSESFSLPNTFQLQEILRLGWEVNLALQVGGVLLALPLTIIAYFLVLTSIRRYRARNQKKSNCAFCLSQSPVPPSGADA